MEQAVKDDLLKLLKSSYAEVFQKLKTKGLRIVAVKGGTSAPMENPVPADLFNSLDQPNAEETTWIDKSKIKAGAALGKYLCSYGSLKNPAIVLVHSATLGTVVHEFFHFLQSQKNKRYCEYVFGQVQVDEAFKKGKLSRVEHDQKLLLMQAVNALAEQEVYAFMRENQKMFGKIENENNELMLNFYNQQVSIP